MSTDQLSAVELEARCEEVLLAGQMEATRLQKEAETVMAAAQSEVRRLRALAIAARAQETREREQAHLQSEIEATASQLSRLGEALAQAEAVSREAAARQRDLRNQVAALVGPEVTNAQAQLRRQLGHEATVADQKAMESQDQVHAIERQREAVEARLVELRAKLTAPPSTPVPAAPSVSQGMWSAGRDPRPESTRGWHGLMGRRIGS